MRALKRKHQLSERGKAEEEGDKGWQEINGESRRPKIE